MPKPNRPTALYTNNNWYFEIPGLVSPHFHTLEGISKTSGEVTIVDGGTNIRHKFSNQLKDFGDITLTRAYDGSIDDIAIQALSRLSFDTCQRFDGNLVKMHCGKEVFRILFLGARVKEEIHPTLSTEGTDKYDVRYVLSISEWLEVR
jgi:hypothetical protein